MFAFLFRPLEVARLLGIPILVMPIVLVLTVLALLSAGGGEHAGTLGLLLLVLAVSLLAHEFGHALVARRLGLRVLDITIWPLGGMARLEGLTERPQVEAPVALAGPTVNLVIAGICALLPGALAEAAVLMNLVLGVGNLVPAFPLDGGRVLRAWFTRRSPLSDATKAAVDVATWLGVALLIAAALQGALLVGALVLLYIWFVGRMELLQVIVRSGRPPTMSVGEVFLRSFSAAEEDRAPDSSHPSDQAEDSPDDDDPARHADLENFRGSLEEFFESRGR